MKAKRLTNVELIKRDARREQILLLDQYSRNCIIHGNYGTQLPNIDLKIEQHRKFTQELLESDKTISTLAKQHDLTENQVKRLRATALMQRNQKASDTLRPALIQPNRDAEIAEIRRKRDTPKPPRRGTFAEMEEVDDTETSDNGLERVA